MANLSSFNSSFLPGDNVSVNEGYGRICSLPLKYTQHSNIQSYPEINISKEIFNSHISRQDQLILPVNETIWKVVLRLYWEESISSVLKVLADQGTIILSPLSRGILSVINIGQRIFNPYLKEISLEKYSQARNYENAAIRFIAFNPMCFKLAVAGIDDSIRIYSNDESSLITLLKHAAQKAILTIAWRKFSSSCVVVGCSTGFLVWTIDPNSNITRPLSQAQHYRYENHFPVTSLEFNQSGQLLLTASINDNQILIWDIDKSVNPIPLKRTSIPYLNLQLSLDGAFMFSSTVGNQFRIFNTENFKSERWNIANGHVSCFQWSPCSRFLLFITSEDPVLYCLGFADETLFNKKENREIQQRALPVADLSKISLEYTEVGGVAQQLAWNGKYLAVSFKDTNSIAVFQTSVRQHHQMHILPVFFIAGIGAEFPNFITFQPKYKTSAAENVLAIGWSSGRIQFFPLV